MKTQYQASSNVNFLESTIRIYVMMWLPWLLLFSDDMIYTTIPTAFYLIVTSLISYCPIKHAWHIVKNSQEVYYADIQLV